MCNSAEIAEDIFDEAYIYRTFFCIERFPFPIKEITTYYQDPCIAISFFMEYTPSVPNYKSFQESWRVKAFSSLTKNIERNIKIYVIK